MVAFVATQFETIAAAAHDCDVIVAATALQIGARSVAERVRIPYVFRPLPDSPAIATPRAASIAAVTRSEAGNG